MAGQEIDKKEAHLTFLRKTEWRAGESRVVDIDTVTRSNTDGTEIDAGTAYTLPAGTLAATGDWAEIEGWFTGNNADNAEVKFRFGSTDFVHHVGTPIHSVNGLYIRARVTRMANGTQEVNSLVVKFNAAGQTVPESLTASENLATALAMVFRLDNTTDTSAGAVNQTYRCITVGKAP